MRSFEGTVLAGPDHRPVEGRVVVEDGEIAAVEETATDSTAIVCPAFVNAHTHVGDSVAKEAAVGLGLEAAVAPPDSLKHDRLREADRERLVAEMRNTARFMAETGTAAFLDFREFGRDGALALREATDGERVRPFVFGSDDPDVLAVADGYGASGAADDDFTDQRAAAREAGVPFAIHAGEPDDTDIDPALDLDPDLLVHMVHAGPAHLDRVADAEVPVAVCPRANRVLGVGTPPVRNLLDHTEVALGTDNVMLNSPSMFREMAYTAKQFDVSAPEVLDMATRAGAEAVGLNLGVLAEGYDAGVLVFEGDSPNLSGAVDPVQAVVRRAGPTDIREAVLPGDG